MNVEIVGRHVQVTDAIQQYAREKAEKVAKFLKQDVRVEVILDHQHERFHVEMIVSGYRGPVIVSHVLHEEARAAVDLAIDKIEHQLRKLKGRRKDHQGESLAGEDRTAPEDADDEVSYDDVIDEELSK